MSRLSNSRIIWVNHYWSGWKENAKETVQTLSWMEENTWLPAGCPSDHFNNSKLAPPKFHIE